MHHIILDGETDFDGWRKTARTLVFNNVQPTDVSWSVQGSEPGLFEASAIETPLEPPQGTFSVPAKFVELAKAAILHRDGDRFAILYRLLWRVHAQHNLLDAATDPDVAHVGTMA